MRVSEKIGKTKRKVAFEMECDINEFRNKCSTFFASKEGQEECVGRHASLVEAGKLRGDVFAECVRRAMSGTQTDESPRVVVESNDVLLPIVYAKIVDTAKSVIPYIFRRQRWNPFKKHEPVLVLLACKDIDALDSAMTLSELGQAYESGGFKPFDESLPWIGIGMSENQRGNVKGQDKAFGISLAYTVETVGFDADVARIIVKARDCSCDLAFAL